MMRNDLTIFILWNQIPYNRPSPFWSHLFSKFDQNLRTVIVTADIDGGLYHPALAHHRYLTFPHWSGVTPYTSTYVFAGSCVFGKQSLGKLSLRPPSLYFQSNESHRELFPFVFVQFIIMSFVEDMRGGGNQRTGGELYCKQSCTAFQLRNSCLLLFPIHWHVASPFCLSWECMH